MSLKTKAKTLFVIPLFILLLNASSFAGEKYKIFSQKYFQVMYSVKNSMQEVDETALYAAQAFARLQKFFHVTPKRRITVILYGTVAEYIKASASPGWKGGRFEGDTVHVQPAGILKQKGVLRTTLEHELSHVFVHEITNGNCPLWLTEGFAVDFSGEMNTVTIPSKVKIKSFRELSNKIQSVTSHKEALHFYAVAGRFVSSLLSKYGQLKFRKLLTALRGGKSFSSACRDAYSMTEAKLFKRLNPL